MSILLLLDKINEQDNDLCHYIVLEVGVNLPEYASYIDIFFLKNHKPEHCIAFWVGKGVGGRKKLKYVSRNVAEKAE